MASAAKSLTYATCKDRVTMIINAVAAVISFYYPVTWCLFSLHGHEGEALVCLFKAKLLCFWALVSPLHLPVHCCGQPNLISKARECHGQRMADEER